MLGSMGLVGLGSAANSLVPYALAADVYGDIDFLNNRGFVGSTVSASSIGLITTSRGSSATTLFPFMAAGASYQTFSSGQPRQITGTGLYVEAVGATNLLLNSAAPATQTVTLGTGTYVLWVNGTGSATSAAGTATGSGFGAATNGSPNTFTITAAGTVTVTVAGSLNVFQLESTQAGDAAGGTSFIQTTGLTAARVADNISVSNCPTFSNTALSLYFQGQLLWPAASGGPQFPSALDARQTDGSDLCQLYARSDIGNINSQVVTSNTSSSVTAPGTISFNTRFKAAASFTPSTIITALNGSNSSGANSRSALPTATSLGISRLDRGAGAFLVERIGFWPFSALTGARLNAVTT